MNTPKYFIKSIRFYFTLFLVFSVLLLLFVDLTLYREGQNIRETVQNQSQIEAQQELQKSLDHSLKIIQQQAHAIAEWDEVHQQFNDPSYYFFWHDERLKESGYSSIRYLAHMPVDIIKFDMSMTQALLSDDAKTRSIIETTAEMIRSLDYDLVMEGIEDKTTLQRATRAQATHIQGYLIGKPSSIAQKPIKI